MVSRFDLETEIMNCWNIVEDIDTVYRYVVDDVEYGKLDTDIVANLMIGMKQLYEIKFRQLFDTFEQLVSENEL
jgi:hypothetical protein